MPAQKHTSLDGVKIDMLQVKKLRILCSERGLPKDGVKRDLVKRLTTWRKGKQRADMASCSGVPPTPKSLDFDFGECLCPAIVVAGAEMGDDQHIISSAKQNLLEILGGDGLTVDRSTPTVSVGNSLGHTWATLPQRVQSLESETSSLKEETASLREEVGLQKVTIASLHGQVTNLTLSVKAYGLVRHRFLVNYKRSQLRMIEEVDQKYIDNGNSIAHGGDVKADAELYKNVTLHRRDDIPVFKSLYGCVPQVIWPISKQSLTSEIL